MLGVDERGDAARLLGLAIDVQGERRLAGGFRAEDLDDAAAGDAVAAEGDVERERAGGDAGDVDLRTRCSPSFMIEPLPNCFSICASAARSPCPVPSRQQPFVFLLE